MPESVRLATLKIMNVHFVWNVQSLDINNVRHVRTSIPLIPNQQQCSQNLHDLVPIPDATARFYRLMISLPFKMFHESIVLKALISRRDHRVASPLLFSK